MFTLFHILDVEMPVVLCVAKMELAGIGFDSEVVKMLQEKLREEMATLEQRAYQLAGRSFSLTSPTDTARVRICVFDKTLTSCQVLNVKYIM